MKHIRTAISIFFVFILFLAFLSGCKGISPEEIGNQYLTLWKDGKYQEAYALLSQESKQSISEEEFIKRHQNIYQGIELSSITYEVGEITKNEGQTLLPYHATYNTELAGPLQYDFQLALVQEEKTWKVQWSPSLLFPQMQAGDTVRVYTYKPSRGEIFDRNGELLAANSHAQTVYGNPAKITDPAKFAQELAPLLDTTPDEVEKILQSKETQRDKVAIFKSYLPGTIPSNIKEKLLAIKGVGIDEKNYTPIRYYPSRLMAHTLGYIGAISQEEMKQLSSKNYKVDDKIGKNGLEQAFEDTLRGKEGFEICILDADGNKKEVLASSEKEDGLDLHLTIDIKLQEKMEQLLKEKDVTGTAIVMDPSTGEILAMASAPSYDPNLFTMKLSQEEYNKLNEDARKPLLNRLTLALYPPGSTFKPFTAAMGLETGKITPSFVFNESIVDNQWKPSNENWPYPPITRVPQPAGPLDLEKAIAWSDNIYFAYTALQIGQEAFQEYAEKYGLGEAVPFDLGTKKTQLSRNGRLDNRKLLADSGYGQGEILVTPIQMASMFSAFANQGTVMKPHIVQSTYKTSDNKYEVVETFEPEVWKEGIIKPETVQTLLPALKKVMTEGTGSQVAIPGLTIAGKTGTAEIGNSKDKEIAWFIGFTTDTTPKRLVCVTLEVPANQGNVKLEIARELLQP